MTPEDFARVRDLFDRAMDYPPADRRRFVDDQMATGDPLRAQLLAMVEVGDDSAFLVHAFNDGLLDKVGLGGANLPSQIGAYKILRVLGRGGMGVVYLALRNDDVFQKVVALKVIGADGESDPSLVARFKQERQILAGLDHPNIARILDGGSTEDGRPFYVMEYVAGSPIDQYCARMQTDVATRVRMMAQACDAVEYLHAHAIAHRDVKPHNILVTLDGRVKLVDFGIAKVETAGAFPRGTSTAGVPTMIMTPGYASPEQIAGDPSGKSGDIYSLAVVLYQLLTGRLPYADANGRPDLTRQLSGAVPDPPSRELSKPAKQGPRTTEVRKLSYPDLDRVVLTGLQRDPLQRYSTVQLLGEDLRRCLDGRPIAARPATIGYLGRKLVTRNPVAAAAVALAVLAAGAGVWVYLDARMERVALEAKEAELERFVALLNDKVARWLDPAVSAAERVADVQSANRMMASESVRDLSERAPDPARVKSLVADLRRVLARADDAVRNEPPVRKEIALAFRRIGDFERSAPLPAIADKAQAAESYRQAARIAADLKPADGSWADQQLTELSGLLTGLGAAPPAAPEVVAAEPPPPAAAPGPAPAAARSDAEAPPLEQAAPEPAVDLELRADLERRIQTAASDAERARRNVDVLRATLASRGQTMRGDIEAAMADAERLIEDARGSVGENDLTTAEDYLRRVAVQLRRVFQAVGG